MATYAEIQADIADELADFGAITADQIKKAIARAITAYEKKPWWFLEEATASFPTVIGQEYYGSASLTIIPKIIELFSVSIVGQNVLIPATDKEIEAWQVISTSSTPTHYTVFEGQIRLYPIPDAVYTIDLSYSGPIPELASDTDVNAWTTFGESLVRQRAKTIIAMNILHADDLAARCRTGEVMAYDELLEENRRRRPVKLLRTDVPYMPSTFNVFTGQ
jgi:hypothetical protein